MTAFLETDSQSRSTSLDVRRREQRTLLTRLPAGLVAAVREGLQESTVPNLPSDERDVLESFLRERVEELRLEHFHWIRLSQETAGARILSEFSKTQMDRCGAGASFETVARL